MKLLTWQLIILSFFYYSLCAINPAALISWLTQKDVTKLGSKNPGATNTFRILGPGAGLIVFIVDFIKPIAAYYLLVFFFKPLPVNFVKILPTLAVIGHCFSLFLRGQGGKGVATFFGSLALFNSSYAIYSLATWVACYVITRTSWQSSLITIFTVITLLPGELRLIFALAALIVGIRHKSNITQYFYNTTRTP